MAFLQSFQIIEHKRLFGQALFGGFREKFYPFNNICGILCLY